LQPAAISSELKAHHRSRRETGDTDLGEAHEDLVSEYLPRIQLAHGDQERDGEH
jgi:hypothetical protein